MSQEYTFAFPGTREAFIRSLERFSHHAYLGNTFYYVHDYIIKLADGEIHFGVARGGHSGGYWFVPAITDFGNRIEFHGTIRYIGSEEHRGPLKKAMERVGNVLLFVLLLPVMAVVWLCRFVGWLVKKIRNRPKPKEPTIREKLFDLMENQLRCTGKQSGQNTNPY